MSTSIKEPQGNSSPSMTSDSNEQPTSPSTEQPRRLFLYGTLMASPLLAWLITGTSSASRIVDERRVRGYLPGYSCRAVLGADFPAVIKCDEDSAVEGFIFHPRNGDDARRIDVFEGDLYRKENVTVLTSSGITVDAYVYVWNGDADSLADTDWSFEEFERTRLEDWLDLMEGMEII